MRMDVKIEGLDRVRRMGTTGPRAMDSEARKAVRNSAAIVRSAAIGKARKFSIGGRFPQSIRYQVRGLTAVIGSLAPTALSIEQGRKPGEVVKFGLILRWIKARGIVRGLFNVQTRALSRKVTTNRRRIGDVNPEELKEAARIVALIRTRGTQPRAFLIPALNDQRDKIERLFKEAVHNAISKIAKAA